MSENRDDDHPARTLDLANALAEGRRVADLLNYQAMEQLAGAVDVLKTAMRLHAALHVAAIDRETQPYGGSHERV